MKQSPREKQQADRLKPSRFSAGGFMGDDTRSVDDIIADDATTLERTGIDRAALGAAMKNAFSTTQAALGAPVDFATGVTGVFYESMGRIPSPFSGDGLFPKGEAIITHTATGRSVILTALSCALVEKHGFFQGKGSRYRIEPILAAELFLGKK